MHLFLFFVFHIVSKKKTLVNIYQRTKMNNFLLPDFNLPPQVSCVANSAWISSGCFAQV